jgi:hypothetical protein
MKIGSRLDCPVSVLKAVSPPHLRVELPGLYPGDQVYADGERIPTRTLSGRLLLAIHDLPPWKPVLYVYGGLGRGGTK